MAWYFENNSLSTLFCKCFFRILHDVPCTTCNTFEVGFHVVDSYIVSLPSRTIYTLQVFHIMPIIG